MINKVYSILKALNIPVKYMLRPELNSKNKIVASYHFFSEGYEAYGDGKGKEFGGSLQVDIFSTVDYTGIVDQTKSSLENNGFRLADSRDSFDSLNANTQYYQKTMIFNYIESEVQNGSKN
jgi:hypothetical protein